MKELIHVNNNLNVVLIIFVLTTFKFVIKVT